MTGSEGGKTMMARLACQKNHTGHAEKESGVSVSFGKMAANPPKPPHHH